MLENNMRSSLYSPSAMMIMVLLQYALAQLCALEHLAHLGRQHERAAVVPPVEVGGDLCRLGRLVFVNEVAGVGEDGELVLACAYW